MVLPFVSTLTPLEEGEWVQLLNATMTGETVIPLGQMTQAQILRADIAVVANPHLSDVLRLKNIKWIQSLWAGVEQLVGQLGPDIPIARLIDPEMARTMAESSLAWTYFVTREMHVYASFQRAHEWRPLPYRHPEGITVGILGLGALGMAAGKRLLEAGFNVVGWSTSPKPQASFDAYYGRSGFTSALQRSDVLVCLLPLTQSTRGLLDRDAFSAMPNGAAVINFARGPIVATDDLVASLNRGDLRHAVLDVFDVEPLPKESPLWDHPKITILPHIAGPTNMRTAAAIVASNIRRYRESGEMPPVVSSTRGY